MSYRLQAQTPGVGDYYNVISCVHLHIQRSQYTYGLLQIVYAVCWDGCISPTCFSFTHVTVMNALPSVI